MGWKMANHRPPADFDMSTPEKAARAGNELVDEIEQIAERYPDAEIARDETNGDMDAFFAAADLDGESLDQAEIERVEWAHNALELWIDHVASTGMIATDEVQAVLDRVNIDRR